ncbi:hypothetical protein [Natrinema longum]|uniref:DUF7975 domain-containing protein n=1 Tax=Natrinema longum TaxID=370324 RepID=A0A8A2UBA7_9EURY|nr:hypothetical protein [Natrinema longum]MBZ6495960.1 hypothetical protein [Natrinema longum]QSW86101.1 hypothetical protein J0X27_04575 [Natrinema longum]
MTRFDAAEPADRRKLYVDAITAHRERGSGFLTLEADNSVIEADDESLEQTHDETAVGRDSESESANESAAELGIPWVQFSDGTINLDCTDAELDVLKGVLDEFPAFKIDDLNRPEEAEGVNVRISAKADPNRIAQFVDDVFLEVYDLPPSIRVWAVGI